MELHLCFKSINNTLFTGFVLVHVYNSRLEEEGIFSKI